MADTNQLYFRIGFREVPGDAGGGIQTFSDPHDDGLTEMIRPLASRVLMDEKRHQCIVRCRLSDNKMSVLGDFKDLGIKATMQVLALAGATVIRGRIQQAKAVQTGVRIMIHKYVLPQAHALSIPVQVGVEFGEVDETLDIGLGLFAPTMFNFKVLAKNNRVIVTIPSVPEGGSCRDWGNEIREAAALKTLNETLNAHQILTIDLVA